MVYRSWPAIITLALLFRIGVLIYLGPFFHTDTNGYREAAQLLADNHRFVYYSPVDRSLEPFTFRMPLFISTWAVIEKLGFSPKVSDWVKAMLQVVYSTLTVILIGITAGKAFGTQAMYPAAWLATFDLWAVYYSVFLTPDCMLLMMVALSLYIGVRAFRLTGAGHFFLFGFTCGITTLVKPIYKYYWLVVIPFIGSHLREGKKIILVAILFLAGLSIPTVSWSIRNWTQAGYFGTDTAHGINLLWMMIDQVSSPTTEEFAMNPKIAQAREMIVQSDGVTATEAYWKIRRGMQISNLEAVGLMKAIAIDTIRKHPFLFIKRMVRNLINLFTVPSPLHGFMARWTGDESWRSRGYSHSSQGKWNDTAFLLNLSGRLVSFLLYFLGPAVGFALCMWKREMREMGLFYGVSILYFVMLTIIIGGPDRYRLPLHPMLWGLFSVCFINLQPLSSDDEKSGQKNNGIGNREAVL